MLAYVGPCLCNPVGSRAGVAAVSPLRQGPYTGRPNKAQYFSVTATNGNILESEARGAVALLPARLLSSYTYLHDKIFVLFFLSSLFAISQTLVGSSFIASIPHYPILTFFPPLFHLINVLTLWKKTIQNYSENHCLKLLKTIVTIHQC